MRDGEVVDSGAISRTLREMFKAHDLPRRVMLGVANQQIVVRHLEMPTITNEAERDAAVRFQMADTIAMPLDDAVIDYQVMGTIDGGDGPPQSRVLVVAARKSMILRLVEAVRNAGLKPDGIDLSAFALVRTLAPAGAVDSAARVYCHLGALANVAVATGPMCLFTRPLTSHLSGEAGVEGLSEELRMSIEYYRSQPHSPAIGDVVLSGPGAAHDQLAQRVGGLLGLPTEVAKPLGHLDDAGLPEGEDPTRHTVSLGLAMAAAA